MYDNNYNQNNNNTNKAEPSGLPWTKYLDFVDDHDKSCSIKRNFFWWYIILFSTLVKIEKSIQHAPFQEFRCIPTRTYSQSDHISL